MILFFLFLFAEIDVIISLFCFKFINSSVLESTHTHRDEPCQVIHDIAWEWVTIKPLNPFFFHSFCICFVSVVLYSKYIYPKIFRMHESNFFPIIWGYNKAWFLKNFTAYTSITILSFFKFSSESINLTILPFWSQFVYQKDSCKVVIKYKSESIVFHVWIPFQWINYQGKILCVFCLLFSSTKSNGAGGRVRTGTSKGWSLSALAHLSYPRIHNEYRNSFMISNFSRQYIRISFSLPARVSFLNWHQQWFWDQWRQLHRVLLRQNW